MPTTTILRARSAFAVLLAPVAAALCAGCGAVPDSPSAPGAAESSSSAWLELVDADASSYAAGPFGDTFALQFTDGDRAASAGRIDAPGEVTAYSLGEVFPGDHLTLEVIAADDGFDPAVALFDTHQNWIHLNDDRHYYNRELNPLADSVSRHYIEQAYVLVSSSPRAESTGAYELHVTKTPNVPYDEPAGQIIYLDFRGASQVVIGRRDPVDVPTFSGEMIAPQFADYTEELITSTTQRVREDFAGFNVTIIGSHEQDQPLTPHTTLYFGSYNSALLGIADSVDTFNQRQIQEAVIFVDTFSVFMSQEPTVTEIAHALANVASHEAGHLLGLHHTADVRDIMDITASLRQMLAPQSFGRAPLNTDTFPAGYQDAPGILLHNVGGDESVVLDTARRYRVATRDLWYDGGPPDPARAHTRFSTGFACR